ncbi:hypothetical protein [Faunimonas pinastri]|nr:hypothetical protein [Faunimonas pinastri]
MALTTQQQDFELAKAAHERHGNTVISLLQHTISLGLVALSAPLVINGGALAALLHVLTEAPNALQYHQGRLSLVFGYLLSGLIAPGLAAGAAYFSQALFTEDWGCAEFCFERPFVRHRRGRKYFCACVLKWVSVALVASSYISLALGCNQFWRLLLKLAAS